jgi:hypothetical protein
MVATSQALTSQWEGFLNIMNSHDNLLVVPLERLRIIGRIRAQRS